MMRVTVHMGWQIESRSYKADSDRWWPRALVSIFEGGRFRTHDVRALLTVTFDTARDADDYAVRMAKKWIEDNYYRNKTVPEVDRAQWHVAIGQTRPPIHVRLGPGAPPACDEPAARIVNLSGIYMNTRNIAALELPARLFGKARFKPGDTIELGSTFFTHCRAAFYYLSGFDPALKNFVFGVSENATKFFVRANVIAFW